MIIALIIYTMTMDKMREIATLKLIGAPDRTIVGMIVQQAIALGGTGFLTGAMLITSVKDYFPRRVRAAAGGRPGASAASSCWCACWPADSACELALTIDPAKALGG